MGGMTTAAEFWFFRLGAIAISSMDWTEAKSEGNRGMAWGENVKLGLEMAMGTRYPKPGGFLLY
jgi:hypothetical protein